MGYDLLLSAILSFVVVLITRVHFSGSASASAAENYFTKFGFSSIVLFIVLFVAFYFLIPFLDSKLYGCLQKARTEEGETNHGKAIRFWSILIAVAWLPYYLSYYPGGIYSDTFTSISFHYAGIICNRHPIFYNALLGLAIRFGELFGQDLGWSMGFFLAVQMILMEVEIIWFLHWMLVHRIDRRIRVCIMAFMVFFPLIPLYAISIWKDTLFSMAFFLWFMFAVDLFLDLKQQRWNIKTLAGYVIGMFLVAFTRNNGMYVVAFAAVMFVILTCTCSLQLMKKLFTYGVLLFSAMLIYFIQGYVYRHAGVIPTDIVEDIGIPIQQICSVVVYDGDITEAQKESINRFIPYENIEEYFRPCVVDSIKWYADMDWGYLELHKPEFWDLWKHLLLQNPQIYIEEYLLETLGFWNVDVSGSNGYVMTEVWSNDYGVAQNDYFEKLFGFSFQHFVNPRHYISCAWFFWVFLIGMVFIMKHYKWTDCVMFMPQMGVWLTLMVATPLAISLRYVSPLLFTLPFAVIVPVLLEQQKPADN